MQGGGQFHTMHDTAGMDAIQQRRHGEMEAARRANRARRHRARHRGERLSWLHLGRHPHGAAHGASAATAEPVGAGTFDGRGEGHGD
jgi:hypothetical protein